MCSESGKITAQAYVTLEIVKHDKCPKREWASAYY
jgi:hypothetical protein